VSRALTNDLGGRVERGNMPYSLDNIPDAIKGTPKHLQEIWIAAFNAAFEEYKGDEAKVHATAWAAVKTKYEQDKEGNWVEIQGQGSRSKGQGGEHSEWFPVFRTGIHTDSSGNTKPWTGADLDLMVEKFDPSFHEPPEVIGHPKTDSPAWGWISGLKREGNALLAKSRDRAPEFIEMLKNGLFKKRSISVYPDGSLRHVGWLGAMPPIVKGLQNVAFSDSDSIMIEFDEGKINQPKKKEETKMKLWEWLKKKAKEDGVNLEDEPQVFSEAEVQEKLAAQKQEFSEVTKAKDTELKAQADALKVREDKIKVDEMAARKAGIVSFAETQKKKGKLIPAMEKIGMGVTAFMEAISGIEITSDFAEAETDGTKKKQIPIEFFQSFVEHLPAAIIFGEVAKGDNITGGNAGEKLQALIKEKLKANTDLTYSQAFAEVQKENPDLATELLEDIRPSQK
jgi:cation transport regulator ChaB